MRYLATVVLIAAILVPDLCVADISNTHHDFSYWSWLFPTSSNPRREICVFCHTPHNAMQGGAADAAPLWNHNISEASYNLYASTSMDAAVQSPDGLSKLCLSCHDGTLALDGHSGMTGTRQLGTGFGTDGGLIGTDLRDDHPISFTFSSSLAAQDGGLRDPFTAPSGISGGGTIETDMLFNGKLECSSCHDVHVARNTNVDGQACWGCHVIDGQWYTPPRKPTLSLRVPGENSALCLTCHIK